MASDDATAALWALGTSFRSPAGSALFDLGDEADRVFQVLRGRVDLTYERGEENPSEWVNPAPFPTFRSLPPATGEPLAVRPEGEREAPPAPGPRLALAATAIVERSLANGIDVVAAQTASVSSSLSIIDGTAANPAIFFASDADVGLYRAGANSFGIAAGGSEVARFGPTNSTISKVTLTAPATAPGPTRTSTSPPRA